MSGIKKLNNMFWLSAIKLSFTCFTFIEGLGKLLKMAISFVTDFLEKLFLLTVQDKQVVFK